MAGSQIAEACMAQKTAVVVINVGSSVGPAVSGLLGLLGGDVAASARTDGPNAMTLLNDAVLASSGCSLRQWTAFNRKWLASPKAAEFLGKALDLIQSEFNGSYLMIFDDPAMSRLLPFWNIVFQHGGVIPRYVVVVEDPMEVVRELEHGLDIDTGSAHLVWLRANLDAELGCRGSLRDFVDPASLAANPAATLAKLSAALDLTFPREINSVPLTASDQLAELCGIIHARKSEAGTERPSDPADWVKVARAVLTGWATGGETDESYYLLDAVRDAFDEAAPAFEGVAAVSPEAGKRLRAIEEELEIAQAEVRRSHEREEDVRTAAERKDARALQVQSELTSRVSYLESALAQRKAEVDDTRQSLDDARRQVGALEQKLASARATAKQEIEQLQKLADERERACSEAQDQLGERYREIVTLSRKLAQETAKAQKLQSQAARLGDIAKLLEQGAGRRGAARWIGWILPLRWHLRKAKLRMEEAGTFDSSAYLAANPDVARAGIDPLKHYLLHGVDEGRQLGIY